MRNCWRGFRRRGMCCHISVLLTEAQKSRQARALAFLTMEVNRRRARRYNVQSWAVPWRWALCNICRMCCRAEATDGDHQGLEAQQMVFSGTWAAIAFSKIWVRRATLSATESEREVNPNPPMESSPQPAL